MDTKPLKGSYDMAKNNIICCNAMCFCGLSLKKQMFHLLYIIVAPLCPAFLKHIDFYKAHCSEKRGALWLAEYLKHTSPYCDAVSWRDDNKTIINEAFVASSGDIITDYNDLYCLFMHRVTSRHVNITMPVFAIRETTTTSTTLHCSTFTFE